MGASLSFFMEQSTRKVVLIQIVTNWATINDVPTRAVRSNEISWTNTLAEILQSTYVPVSTTWSTLVCVWSRACKTWFMTFGVTIWAGPTRVTGTYTWSWACTTTEASVATMCPITTDYIVIWTGNGSEEITIILWECVNLWDDLRGSGASDGGCFSERNYKACIATGNFVATTMLHSGICRRSEVSVNTFTVQANLLTPSFVSKAVII